jgi:SAM-dependent methyltransferase
MSGFDKSWLALREPADRQARARPLIDALCRHLLQNADAPSLLDIGCGTGSTYRTLSTVVPEATSWQLLDYDPELLLEAERQIGASAKVRFRRHDLNDLDALPLEGVSVVTASALFDLCSADFCDRFVDRLARQKTGLYAALNYDGVMAWSEAHPLDEQVVKSFNEHQRQDKGFGAALGPDATEHLDHALRARGYSVEIGTSPWRLGPKDLALQTELLQGIAKPVTEIGVIGEADLEDWLAFRLSVIERPGSSCVIGHTDLIALHHR